MPKGVEHVIRLAPIDLVIEPSHPVMPKGVEHGAAEAEEIAAAIRPTL